jgi:hypothetical protein
MDLCFIIIIIINIKNKPDLWRQVLKTLACIELVEKIVSVSRKLDFQYIAHKSLRVDCSTEFTFLRRSY